MFVEHQGDRLVGVTASAVRMNTMGTTTNSTHSAGLGRASRHAVRLAAIVWSMREPGCRRIQVRARRVRAAAIA